MHVLFPGVPINAAISKMELFPNSQPVPARECRGLLNADSGKIEISNRCLDTSFSLTGIIRIMPTMLASLRNVKTALYTQSREIAEMSVAVGVIQ